MPIPFDTIAGCMMEAAGLKNCSRLARDLGITPQALSNYKKRGDFPAHLVIEFAQKRDLSIDYLVNGKLPVGNVPGIQAYCPHVINTILTPDEAIVVEKLLKIIRGDDKSKAMAFKYSLDALEAAHV